MAVNFDRANSESLEYDVGTALDGLTGLTVGAWVSPFSTQNDGKDIITKWHFGSPQDLSWVLHRSSGSLGYRFEVAYQNNNTDSVVATLDQVFGYQFVVGAWRPDEISIATWDPTNGWQVDTAVISRTSIADNNDNLVIAGQADGGNHWDGAICHPFVYRQHLPENARRSLVSANPLELKSFDLAFYVPLIDDRYVNDHSGAGYAPTVTNGTPSFSDGNPRARLWPQRRTVIFFTPSGTPSESPDFAVGADYNATETMVLPAESPDYAVGADYSAVVEKVVGDEAPDYAVAADYSAQDQKFLSPETPDFAVAADYSASDTIVLPAESPDFATASDYNASESIVLPAESPDFAIAADYEASESHGSSNSESPDYAVAADYNAIDTIVLPAESPDFSIAADYEGAETIVLPAESPDFSIAADYEASESLGSGAQEAVEFGAAADYSALGLHVPFEFADFGAAADYGATEYRGTAIRVRHTLQGLVRTQRTFEGLL